MGSEKPTRRRLLVGAGSTALAISAAGCMEASGEVMRNYRSGYESLQDGHDERDSENYQAARENYTTALEDFRDAKEAAGDGSVESKVSHAIEVTGLWKSYSKWSSRADGSGLTRAETERTIIWRKLQGKNPAPKPGQVKSAPRPI